MHTLRQLARRALVSRLPDATMKAALPRPLCGLLLGRAPAAAAAAAPRHPVFGALRASRFCPGSRALLHARARPLAHRTAVAPHPPRAQAVSFEQTGLAAELLEAAEALGLKTATEIQAQAIPEIVKGGHVVMASHTGSGKTLAFLLPVVHCIREEEARTGERVKPKRPRAVVLEPTRELAQQVLGVCKGVCHYARFSSALISGGGEKLQTQREVLATPRDVLVGTPGRLLQLLREGAWYAGDVRFLVVDEADTLLDKGFGPEVEALLAPVLATGGQAVLVSATMTKAVEALLATLLPDARRVATSSLHRAVAGARHRFLPVPGDSDKLDALRSLLATEGGAASRTRTMVFCNTLPSCRAVEHALAEAGLHTVSYNGDMAGDARVESVRAFTAGGEGGEGSDATPPPIMVCTDIAARGLDFGCSVGHVVMFDFPLNSVDYLHRTGRTARAGKGGRITSLVTKRDRVLAEQIEANIRTGAALDELSSSKAKVELQKKLAAAAAKTTRAGAGVAARRYGAGPAGRRTGPGAPARGTRGAARAGAPAAGAFGKRKGPPGAAGAGKKFGAPAAGKFSKFAKRAPKAKAGAR